MNTRDQLQPSIALLPAQTQALGALARRLLREDAISAKEAKDHDPGAIAWLMRLGYLRPSTEDESLLVKRRAQTPWPALFSLFGDQVEALLDITPKGAPMTLTAAFEATEDRTTGRRVYSGRGPSPRDAIEGALWEAVERLAGKTAGEADVQWDSNGVAAGASQETAHQNALFELIERDAIAIWWRSGHRAPLWRPRSRGAQAALAPIETWLAAHGRYLYFLNLTSDLGLPVVLALTTDEAGEKPLIAGGADFQAFEAAYKAAGELLQMESNLRFIAQNVEKEGPEVLPQEARALWDWHQSASLEHDDFLAPLEDANSLATAKSHDGLAALEAALDEGGLGLTWKDLPGPVEGLFAARALCPDLMDLYRINERAREVPKRLGLDAGLDPARALNETPIPL